MSNGAWRMPSRWAAFDFWLRSWGLILARSLRERIAGRPRRWPSMPSSPLAEAPVLARRRTPLWTDGRPDEFVLVAGKVHNLRVARPAFHAIDVPAGEVFSFWRQLGRPSARRGFVLGREVREGCVVPTLAGGICQISNAIAAAAVQAGFELVERHAHSARIEAGAPDPDGLDATVFWNYVDLRLRAPFDWRMELELGADGLVLTLKAHAPTPRQRTVPLQLQRADLSPMPVPPTARGCLTCHETACFRHRPAPNALPRGRTALLLDSWSPEFERYLGARHDGADRFVSMPFRLAFWRAAPVGWRQSGAAYRAVVPAIRRALLQRATSRMAGGRRQAAILQGRRWLAQAYADRLSPLHTHLVVDLGLLAHLEPLGVLAGRSCEVLAADLPMSMIEAQLNAASRLWPEDETLKEFRASPPLVQAEDRALAAASRLVTAHAHFAAHASARTGAVIERLAWCRPEVPRPAPREKGLPVVVYPASVLARKGARALAAALRGLPCRLRVLGTPTKEPGFWRGVDLAPRSASGDPLADAIAVVLPAHVEPSPRLLLRALAIGLPVIATAECGLEAQAGLALVPAGNVDDLRQALKRAVG